MRYVCIGLMAVWFAAFGWLSASLYVPEQLEQAVTFVNGVTSSVTDQALVADADKHKSIALVVIFVVGAAVTLLGAALVVRNGELRTMVKNAEGGLRISYHVLSAMEKSRDGVLAAVRSNLSADIASQFDDLLRSIDDLVGEAGKRTAAFPKERQEMQARLEAANQRLELIAREASDISAGHSDMVQTLDVARKERNRLVEQLGMVIGEDHKLYPKKVSEPTARERLEWLEGHIVQLGERVALFEALPVRIGEARTKLAALKQRDDAATKMGEQTIFDVLDELETLRNDLAESYDLEEDDDGDLVAAEVDDDDPNAFDRIETLEGHAHVIEESVTEFEKLKPRVLALRERLTGLQEFRKTADTVEDGTLDMALDELEELRDRLAALLDLEVDDEGDLVEIEADDDDDPSLTDRTRHLEGHAKQLGDDLKKFELLLPRVLAIRQLYADLHARMQKLEAGDLRGMLAAAKRHKRHIDHVAGEIGGDGQLLKDLAALEAQAEQLGKRLGGAEQIRSRVVGITGRLEKLATVAGNGAH